MQLGEFIRTKREENSHTQPAAAAIVEVDPLTFGRWERGQMPTLRHAYRLADYLGTTLDELRQYVERR